MAATRLIAMHVQKHEGMMESLKGRLDYAKNGLKTADGEYISSYECDPMTVDKEFLLSKSEYERCTGRKWKNDIIAYQIRQSFKPGEITPEEANRLGYETAMRWTKGKHAFIVATHIDHKHIHNHIIYNSTTLDCSKKYNYFRLCGLALQVVSDRVCLENGYSIIDKKKSERQPRESLYHRKSARSQIKEDIKKILLEQEPKDLEELLKRLEEQNYIVKRAKHVAVKRQEDQRFVRLSSLGEGFEDGDFDKILGEDSEEKAYDNKTRFEEITPKSKKELKKMVDIQEAIASGRGPGFEKWAKKHNVKQLSESLVYMKTLGIDTIPELCERADKVAAKSSELLSTIKSCETKYKELKELKMHIINYMKTKDVYAEYKKGGYKKAFFEEHREELTLHKAAKEAFGKVEGTIPKVKEINEMLKETEIKKRAAYVQYNQIKDENRNLQAAKYNLERFVNQVENEENTKEKSKRRDEQDL